MGATCEFTNGGEPEHYDKETWDYMRFNLGMACTEVSSLTELLGVIKKLCFDTGRCTYKEYAAVEAAIYRALRQQMQVPR